MSIGSAVFLQLTHTVYNEAGRPQNCPFFWGDPGPDLKHGFLGSPKSTTQTRLVQPLCSTDRHTNRHINTQTYRPCYICSKRPYLCTPRKRCDLIMDQKHMEGGLRQKAELWHTFWHVIKKLFIFIAIVVNIMPARQCTEKPMLVEHSKRNLHEWIHSKSLVKSWTVAE